jgi:uncharacterized protein with FMN-binding domain
MHASSAPAVLGGALSGPVSPATSTTSPSSSPNPSSSTTTTTTSLPVSGAARTATGNSEQYGYGVLAVKLTEQAGRITEVSVSSLQTAEQYSQGLAQQVIPLLRNEVLSAQSAHISGISGATYTSEAYAYSVQSALDSLGVK